ncbi:MAG: glycosyltransferase family 4 protein [Candidatus Bathyarchaeota archaeon]|nr:glycosyltransferase family 4 protein [Candidatus Bathyarchaeota archaeon]MDH5495375.1 glycosyltransferase family 4 protein [Candidatus Bathyarchaeota archaeon]
MRLAILYSHLREFGGVERVVLKQAELLRGQGHEVTCLFAYVDTKRFTEYVKDKVTIQSYFNPFIPNNETLRVVLSLPFAPLISPAFKGMNLLICHGYGPAPWIGYNIKLINGINYLTYVHSIPRFLYLGSKERRLWRQDPTRRRIFSLGRFSFPLIAKIDRMSVINSKHVFANSHYTAGQIRKIYGSKASVCYPPVDTKLFKLINDKSLIDEVCSRYRVSKPIVLSTGRIIPLRKLEWLIHAMKYIVKIFPSATLAITGEVSANNADYVRTLVRVAHSLGVEKSVRLLGFVPNDELVKLYNTADVYVHSCPHEAFGLSPVEAMACGTPAVVWDDGAGPCETVINGRTGFRARPYDVEDFAEKIMKIFDMDNQTVSKFSSEYVQRNFSCEKHLELLNKAIGKL